MKRNKLTEQELTAFVNLSVLDHIVIFLHAQTRVHGKQRYNARRKDIVEYVSQARGRKTSCSNLSAANIYWKRDKDATVGLKTTDVTWHDYAKEAWYVLTDDGHEHYQRLVETAHVPTELVYV